MRSGLVSAIVINYNASLDMLSKCLDALLAQTYGNIEVILVDNGSTNNVLPEVQKSYPSVKLLPFDRNLGFAEGNNRAVAEANGEFILFVNNDAYCAADAVERMVEVITSADDIVGVAPKMMFEMNKQMFDSIGSLIDSYCCAFNMGIGQLDIGQYDQVERVFGGCFGATLTRRSAFDLDQVGLLDKSYFMYYEDVDWCLRANLLGFRFLTAPKAVVYHEHSASTKKFAYKRKYYLIERNLIRTCVKNFKTLKAVKVVVRRVAAHTRNILTGPFNATSFHIALTALWDIPRFWIFRRGFIQRRRKISDDAVFRLSYGERPFFDPKSYAPIYNLEALHYVYRRLWCVTGQKRYLDIALAVEQLRQGKLRFDGELLKSRLREIMAGEPLPMTDFIEHIKEDDERV